MRKTELTEPSAAQKTDFAGGGRWGERGHSRTPVLVAVIIGLGIAVSAFWFSERMKREAGRVTGQDERTAAVSLSAATRAVLERLEAPVDLRFYNVLDPATVPEAEVAFAGRVDRLLSAYEEAGGGKIKLIRLRERPGSGKSSADADGIRPFNLEKGDACFLGLAVACNGQKESFPRLLPEWEPALEADVSRAIARVMEHRSTNGPPPVATAPDPSVVEEVRQLVPQLESISLQEGTRILRQAALEKFGMAANELQSKVNEAKQGLIQARQSKSEAEQQAAMAHLQQVDAEQGQKLKEVAARSQAQVKALEYLKGAGGR